MIAPWVAAASTGWVALLAAAPVLPVPFAGVLYLLGAAICHQVADRSFHLDDAQLPVCARCFGIYLGTAVGAWVGVITRRPVDRRALIAGALPTMLTVALESVGLWAASNAVRAIAGVPLGLAVGLVMAAAATLHYGPCASRRPIASSPPTLT